jgi:hypothetical protein
MCVKPGRQGASRRRPTTSCTQELVGIISSAGMQGGYRRNAISESFVILCDNIWRCNKIIAATKKQVPVATEA